MFWSSIETTQFLSFSKQVIGQKGDVAFHTLDGSKFINDLESSVLFHSLQSHCSFSRTNTIIPYISNNDLRLLSRSQIKEVPAQLSGHLAKKHYLHATQVLVSALALGGSTLEDVEALKELRTLLQTSKQVWQSLQ